MGTLVEKLMYTKKAREEITDAIIAKGVDCPTTAPFCTFDDYILQIKSGGGGSGGSNVNYRDIFNHDDVVGLNPLYAVTHAQSQWSSAWRVTSDKIYTPNTANANFTLVYPIDLTGFTYICFEADVTGKNGNYNYSTVGLRKLSSGLPSDYYGSCTGNGKNLTMYTNKTNYDGTEPWYNLTRQIIKVPITITEPCMVSMSCCDCAVNIYSIWLEGPGPGGSGEAEETNKQMLLDDCVYDPEIWDASKVSLKCNSTNIIAEMVPKDVRTLTNTSLHGVYLPTNNLKSIMFTKPLPIGDYKKLCVEVTMVPYFPSSADWAHTYIMLCSTTSMSNVYTPTNLIKQATVWTSAYGSDSTPYYSNEVFEIDLTDITATEVYLCISHCDGQGKINKIWLEDGSIIIKNATIYDYVSSNNLLLLDAKWPFTLLTGSEMKQIIPNNITCNSDYMIFNGSSSWVNCGQINPSYVTVEALVRYNAIGANNAEEHATVGNWHAGGYGIVQVNGKYAGEINIGGTYHYVYGSAAYTDKVVYLAVTYDGTTLKFYQDGELVDSKAVSGTIKAPSNNTVLALGCNPNGSTATDAFLNGRIYATRLYSRALSDAEIKSNYKIDKIRYSL